MLAQAKKDPANASLVIGLHHQFQLWRLCERASCRRARSCCGDVLRCSARRWPVAQAIATKLNQRPVTGPAATRLVKSTRQLWSEQNGVLCEHEAHLFLNMPKGPFLRVFRNNPDGSKSLVFHRDLTDEQARKLQRENKR